MHIPERVAARILNHADRAPNGCLVSRYSAGSHGYAQIGWHEDGERFVTIAHRAIWIYTNGEIAEGETIDHTCKTRKCVELSHMRLLPNFENARRTAGRDWPVGQCVNGHDNKHLRWVNGGRKKACGICKQEWNRRYHQAKSRKHGVAILQI